MAPFLRTCAEAAANPTQCNITHIASCSPAYCTWASSFCCFVNAKPCKQSHNPPFGRAHPVCGRLGEGGGTGQAASAMQYTVMQSAMSRSEWQSAPTSYTLMLVGRVAWCGCSFIMDLGHHAIRPTNPTRGGVIGSVGSDGLQPTLAPSNTPSRRLDATISLDTHESIIHSVSYLHSASKHVGCYYTIHNWQPW